jgi:hypothetical protein
MLSSIELGAARAHRNITIFPLICPVNGSPEYRTLGEAIQDRTLTVTEVSQSGSVPNLLVVNRGDTPVLLLDGEELLGAKQNRVLNSSILLKEHSETIIPVSCTEQGRWAYASDGFVGSDSVMAHLARARKSRSVSESLAGAGHFGSDQGEVWSQIRALHEKAHTSSPTHAMHDVFRARQAELEACLKAFPAVAHQNGLLVLVNGVVAGFDVVSRPESYARFHAKLLRSYVIEALVHAEQIAVDAGPARERSKAFLQEAQQCEGSRFPSVGYGMDVRIKKEGLTGTALVHENRVVHTVFFKLTPEDEMGRMSPLRTRRRHGVE